MLLILEDSHKQHLEFLKDAEAKVVSELCEVALDHLRKVTNSKIVQGLSQRLNVEPEVMQNTINGISYLFIEAAKIKVTELEFQDSILILGFNEQTQQEITKCYLTHEQEIRSLLTSFNIGIPHYHNLEWRIDVEMESRALRCPKDPIVLMRWAFEEDGKKTFKVLQTDPVNLIHMTEVLDEALQEAKSQHARRIIRNIK